jgi:hypothetical protein
MEFDPDRRIGSLDPGWPDFFYPLDGHVFGHLFGYEPTKWGQGLHQTGTDHQQDCEQEELFPADADEPTGVGVKASGEGGESLGPGHHENQCLIARCLESSEDLPDLAGPPTAVRSGADYPA